MRLLLPNEREQAPFKSHLLRGCFHIFYASPVHWYRFSTSGANLSRDSEVISSFTIFFFLHFTKSSTSLYKRILPKVADMVTFEMLCIFVIPGFAKSKHIKPCHVRFLDGDGLPRKGI